MGGANGKYMFCKECHHDPEPGLVSLVDRRFATERVLKAIASAIQGNSALIPLVIEAVGATLPVPSGATRQSLKRRIRPMLA